MKIFPESAAILTFSCIICSVLNHKSTITKQLPVCIIILLMVFSSCNSYAMYTVGLRSWTTIGGTAILTEPLGNTKNNPLTISVGPSYSYYFDKDTSLAFNMLASKSTSLVTNTPYLPDSESSYSSPAYEIFDLKDVYRLELFSTLNRRLLKSVTGFIGFKFNTNYASGIYAISSGRDEDKEQFLSEPEDAFYIINSYGPGGGFAFNNHLIGELYLMTSISYVYMLNAANLKYDSNTESGIFLSHEPMAKLGLAYFIAPIKSTVEFGIQSKMMYYQTVLSGNERYSAMKDLIDFNLGVILNVTKVF